MPNAAEVAPAKWEKISVLFDDGGYSVIWGTYYDDGPKKGVGKRTMGCRWNGQGPGAKGFPISSGYPVWHVEPDLFVMPILLQVLTLAHTTPGQQQYVAAIEDAIEEFARREAGAAGKVSG